MRRPPVVESLEERLQLSTVTPTSVTLGSGSALDLTRAQTVPLTITLPQASVTNQVDIALLLDGTGSVSFTTTVANLFTNLMTSLQTAMPAVNFGFGMAQFQDYGGPFHVISGDNPGARPFFLDQPIVTAATASANGTTLNALMTNALSQRGPGFGGDTPEPDIEALYQLATGAGLDGNGNGTMLDSGPAGSPGTILNPGTSGDIPPFSSNVGLTSGSLGGMGWRPGAEHIVILATDTAPVASFAGNTEPATITGLGGLTVPSTAFESTAGRVGYDSTVVGGVGTGSKPAVAPLGGATVQETVTALNNLGIKVIGMGPGAAPTSSTAAALAPSTFFSALGRLTGTTAPSTGEPLVLSSSISNSQLTSTVAGAINTAAAQPTNVSLSTSSLPAGLSFTPAPGGALNILPGASATFDVTLNVNALPYTATFNANFVDTATGAVLGTVPFQISLASASGTGWPGGTVNPPTVVSGQRIGRPMQPASIVITYSTAMNASSVQDLRSYVLKGPAGRILAFASATYNPTTNAVTLKTKGRLNYRATYSLEILAQGPAAVTNNQGVALDGMKTGSPGDNYYGRLRAYRLTPAPLTTPKILRKAAVNVLAKSRVHHR